MNSKRETKGRKPRRNLDEIISNLTNKEKEDIVRRYLEIHDLDNKNKKKEEVNSFSWPNARRAYIFGLDWTSFYKKKKIRKYKFDFMKPKLIEIFEENKAIYGSRKIAIELEKMGVLISDWTLRNHLNRWNIKTKTRVKRRKRGIKKLDVNIPNLVLRNFNPLLDNILATDVSYIPIIIPWNFCYLSVVISHKTKAIEAWDLSLTNDIDLVLNTYKQLNRYDFIIHSNHRVQYSSKKVSSWVEKRGGKVSMSRIGNSLDNREVEYFFSRLKGEYLNHLNTHKMTFQEIKAYIKF